MRFNRPMLYLGTFLLATGGIVVAADQGAIDVAALAGLVRLWPLALVAIGVALVLRRTRVSLGGGLLAAAAPGLLLGSSFAILPRFAGDCAARSEPVAVADERGAFVGPASVVVETGCGTLTLNTAPGNGWAFSAANTAGFAPTIASDAQSLWIEGGHHGWGALGAGRDAWNLTLPTSEISDLTVTLNAGRSHVALPGVRIGSVDLKANLSDVVIDATQASLGDLSVALVMSNASIHLPSGSDLVGSIRVGGGELHLCAAPDVGLFVSARGLDRERGLEIGGVETSGDSWRSANYDTAAYHADLEIRSNFSTVTINPIGGCR